MTLIPKLTGVQYLDILKIALLSSYGHNLVTHLNDRLGTHQATKKPESQSAKYILEFSEIRYVGVDLLPIAERIPCKLFARQCNRSRSLAITGCCK